MITTITKRIPCSEAKAQTLPAFQLGGTWENGYLSFNVYALTGENFRMVHNGSRVLAVIEGDQQTQTETIYNVFEAATMDEINTEIDRLGLDPLPAEQLPS
jgi:hypothetical protein